MRLDSPLTDVTGIGPKTAQLYHRLGLVTIGDLINHYPRRYDDFSHISFIRGLKPGLVTVKARLIDCAGHYARRGLHISWAVVSDQTGSLRVVWFNQPYRLRYLKRHQTYYLSGDYDLKNGRLALYNPSIEPLSSPAVQTARVRPVYPTTKGLSNPQIRQTFGRIRDLIVRVPEDLPEWLVKDAQLEPLSDALELLHFPRQSSDIKLARNNIGFREIFSLSLASQLIEANLSRSRSRPLTINHQLLADIIDQLPFDLTAGQKKITNQLLESMTGSRPLNSLIQGDVGSGKTVIIALVALNAVYQSGQVVVMAPTAILADQHYQTFQRLFGTWLTDNQLRLLTASTPAKEKQQIRVDLERGQCRLVIGTHALISQQLTFNSLDLVVIDEQHRFGVEQRRQLLQLGGRFSPHTLTVSATPIPRSLKLVLYNELDIFRLTDKPSGRKPIKTKIVSLSQRLDVYRRVLPQAGPKNQVYIVCPAIDADRIEDSLVKTAQTISQIIPSTKFAQLHGRQKATDRQAIMAGFVAGRYNVLLTTSIIEAGLDIKTVTTIIILSPQRFGLAQMHQLRGRVGRNSSQAICYLASADNLSPSRRLQALLDCDDGFELSNIDLEIRGPGAIYGTQQWGKLDLSLAPLSDTKMVEKARFLAGQFISRSEQLSDYPRLAVRIKHYQQVTKLN